MEKTMNATPKQTFFLFRICKLDVRPLGLSLDEASRHIDEAVKSEDGREVVRKRLEDALTCKFPNGAPKVESKSSNYQAIYDEAFAAADAAGAAHQPTPMCVQEHVNMVDDSSPVNRQWVIDSGVCGFAWIHFYKANTSFVAWLRKRKIGGKAYNGGWDISCSAYGQSMEKKVRWATEFAAVMQKHGVGCCMMSRMD